MALVLEGKALPEQIGASLMLLCLKEETPVEITGFIKSAHATISQLYDAPQIDLE